MFKIKETTLRVIINLLFNIKNLPVSFSEMQNLLAELQNLEKVEDDKAEEEVKEIKDV